MIAAVVPHSRTWLYTHHLDDKLLILFIFSLIMSIAANFNYWIVIILMMTGLYIVIAQDNLIKKLIGINIFQTSIFVLFISLGKITNGTAPILTDTSQPYSAPLPHVLILTAIVVGIATTALGLALVIRINKAFGTVEDHEIQQEL